MSGDDADKDANDIMGKVAWCLRNPEAAAMALSKAHMELMALSSVTRAQLDCVVAENKRLRAENERLRAALAEAEAREAQP